MFFSYHGRLRDMKKNKERTGKEETKIKNGREMKTEWRKVQKQMTEGVRFLTEYSIIISRYSDTAWEGILFTNVAHDDFLCQQKIRLTPDSPWHTKEIRSELISSLLFSLIYSGTIYVCAPIPTDIYQRARVRACTKQSSFISLSVIVPGSFTLRNYVTATKIAKIFGENAQQEKCA